MGASAALDQPAVRGDLVGAVNRDIEAIETVEGLDFEAELARPGLGLGEVATQRIRRSRAASSGSRCATVVPVPSPTAIPSSTSSAACRAASRFSFSIFTA